MNMEDNQQFVPLEKFEKLSKFLEKISKRLTEIEAENKRIKQQLQSDDDIDTCEGFGPKPVAKPRNPNAESYTLELSHGPYTIYRDDGESDEAWQLRKHLHMNERVMFLNGSGVSGTPEQLAYLRRIEERLGKKILK